MKIYPRETGEICCRIAMLGKQICDIQIKEGVKLYQFLKEFGSRYNKRRIRINATLMPRDYRIREGDFITVIPKIGPCKCKQEV